MRRHISWLIAMCSVLLSMAWPVAAQDHGRIGFTATAGRLTAVRPDGRVVWTMPMADGRVPTWTVHAGQQIVLDNGMVLDAQGRIVKRLYGRGSGGRDSDLTPTTDESAWDPLVELSSRTLPFSPPLFDSQGNGWVFLSDGVSLFVARSNAHDGTWQPLETLIREATEVGVPEATIDLQDRITLVFRSEGVDPYQLVVMRYIPQTGWTTPQVIFSGDRFFQAMRVAADAQGNVVVIFDPNEPLFSPELWTIAYDASTGSWGEASRITPANAVAYVPTLVRNRAADRITLIYLFSGGTNDGLQAHQFDSQSKTWGPAHLLPGSWRAMFSGAGADSRYPATVDDDGNVTVFWATAYTAVYANRQQGGMWQRAHRLLSGGRYLVDLENFADAEISDAGTVWGVLTRHEGDANRLYVFRYHATKGWQPPENPYSYSPDLSTTRARIAPYQGDRAVATFYADQEGQGQITSLLYDGTSWASDLLDIPGTFFSFFQETVTDRGEVLLVFEPGTDEGVVPGISATWLRSAPEP